MSPRCLTVRAMSGAQCAGDVVGGAPGGSGDWRMHVNPVKSCSSGWKFGPRDFPHCVVSVGGTPFPCRPLTYAPATLDSSFRHAPPTVPAYPSSVHMSPSAVSSAAVQDVGSEIIVL